MTPGSRLSYVRLQRCFPDEVSCGYISNLCCGACLSVCICGADPISPGAISR